jgi:hypothetical protein
MGVVVEAGGEVLVVVDGDGGMNPPALVTAKCNRRRTLAAILTEAADRWKGRGGEERVCGGGGERGGAVVDTWGVQVSRVWVVVGVSARMGAGWRDEDT